MCYSKLGNNDASFGALAKGLAIDPAHKKTLYRRGLYFETVKKDYDKALEDFRKALGTGGVLTDEDKVIAKAVDRVRKELDKQNAQEKKMWSKAFA